MASDLTTERLNLGGLMRCCTDSWRAAMAAWSETHARPPVDGDIITCEYVTGPVAGAWHQMERVAGRWYWSRHPAVATARRERLVEELDLEDDPVLVESLPRRRTVGDN